MSFEFFEDDSKSSAQLPFVNEWIDRGGDVGSIHDVQSIAPNKKQTGYMVRTNLFAIFVWANSQTATRLNGLMDRSRSEMVPVPVLKTTNKDPFYVLGLDKERQCFFSITRDEFTDLVENCSIGPIEPTSSPTPPTPTAGKTQSKG